MKKTGYIAVLLFGALALLGSCEKPELLGDPVLDVVESHIDLDGKSQIFPVKINTNVDYTIEEPDVEWLRMAHSGTKSVETIEQSFEVDENKTGYTRKAKIIFRYVSKEAKEWKEQVEIIQSSLTINTSLSVLFTGEKFVVPRLYCYFNHAFEGSVDFGDGTKEKYKRNSEHVYTVLEPHTISIEGKNAFKVKFEQISGIEEIDLSRFGI